MIEKLLTAGQRIPYDPEAPVVRELRRLGYVSLRDLADEFEDDAASSKTSRAHLRYLAALLPDLDRAKLAAALSAIVDNPTLLERDIRMILDGRSLADPTRRTREVPIEAIQTIGRMLMRGETNVETARAARVSVNTVEAVDSFLGLSQAHHDRQIDAAVTAVREGWSVRELARSINVSKSQAHRFMVQARGILVELGEVAQ